MHPVHNARSRQDAPSPFTIPADARGVLAAGIRLILPQILLAVAAISRSRPPRKPVTEKPWCAKVTAMKKTLRDNIALIALANVLLLTTPAIVQAHTYNLLSFTQPIRSEKGEISPIGPIKDARYLERTEACQFVKTEFGWGDCKVLDILAFNPGGGIDTLLLNKPTAIGFVNVEDFFGADAKGAIVSIEESLRTGAKTQSERLGKTIQFTGWRVYPVADKARGLIYFATDWTWDGEPNTNVRAILLGRHGYTVMQLMLDATAIDTMVRKAVATYKPDPTTAYSDFRQGDKLAAVGGLGVLATVLGVKYAKPAAAVGIGLLALLGKQAGLLLILPLLMLGGLFGWVKGLFSRRSDVA
jgi:uncharacterized membrane-anchored protein